MRGRVKKAEFFMLIYCLELGERRLFAADAEPTIAVIEPIFLLLLDARMTALGSLPALGRHWLVTLTGTGFRGKVRVLIPVVG